MTEISDTLISNLGGTKVVLSRELIFTLFGVALILDTLREETCITIYYQEATLQYTNPLSPLDLPCTNICLFIRSFQLPQGLRVVAPGPLRRAPVDVPFAPVPHLRLRQPQRAVHEVQQAAGQVPKVSYGFTYWCCKEILLLYYIQLGIG